MTHLAEVHTIYETNCRSIPGMLRQAADNLEIEEAEGYDKTVAMIAVQVTESGQVQLYGWGDTNQFHALGALSAGQTAIGSMIMDNGE